MRVNFVVLVVVYGRHWAFSLSLLISAEMPGGTTYSAAAEAEQPLSSDRSRSLPVQLMAKKEPGRGMLCWRH